MALAIRGFILGAPKPNTLQIPSCKSYQQKAMTMLQTQHHGLKHSRKISHSLITCVEKQSLGTGSGPKINQTTSSEQKDSDLSSSNSERTGKKSKGSGEANATPKKTVAS
ncbi:hypothetical protein RchiOBHm_Chr5g0030081 [Rosa chinensis]|uniref:Uncharacterized protein n=1 Tax=Rosa chinensis TaxID=74649 RepID=A0A2P6Q9X2_ROSCH|nr:uncharacterized protein LOC112165998 [Rosa chinensis]PRQ30944.1 hypothetical protein RchiOBHm_Chr5g0030081 [Rosa chinensis]